MPFFYEFNLATKHIHENDIILIIIVLFVVVVVDRSLLLVFGVLYCMIAHN